MKHYKSLITAFSIFTILLASCTKFLAEKPSKAIAAVETIKDMQLLLDNIEEINQAVPGIIEIGADDYFVEYNTLMARPSFEQEVYLWRDPLFMPADLSLHWVSAYKPIMVANVVLERLATLSDASPAEIESISGQALFVRAFAYALLSQIYASPYDPQEPEAPYGLLYRYSSDINSPTTRIGVALSYANIIADLKAAAALLPIEAPYKTRPSKVASLAALARVYLTMSDYTNALYYADAALAIKSDLIDFNSLNAADRFPFALQQNESLYFAMSTSALLLKQSRANIAEDLLRLYQDGDLRKQIYYYAKTNGLIGFKGSYTGDASPLFVGPTVDEMYLIKAECLIRIGQRDDGIAALNKLIQTRWDKLLFVPYATDNDAAALQQVLDERRKELVFRGLRWADLRRLNRDPTTRKSIFRTLQGNDTTAVYELKPASMQYTYLIPQQVLIRNGLAQNPR